MWDAFIFDAKHHRSDLHLPLLQVLPHHLLAFEDLLVAAEFIVQSVYQNTLGGGPVDNREAHLVELTQLMLVLFHAHFDGDASNGFFDSVLDSRLLAHAMLDDVFLHVLGKVRHAGVTIEDDHEGVRVLRYDGLDHWPL